MPRQCADCGVRLCFCPTPRAHDSDGFNYNGAWLCYIHALRAHEEAKANGYKPPSLRMH